MGHEYSGQDDDGPKTSESSASELEESFRSQITRGKRLSGDVNVGLGEYPPRAKAYGNAGPHP